MQMTDLLQLLELAQHYQKLFKYDKKKTKELQELNRLMGTDATTDNLQVLADLMLVFEVSY